MSKWELQDIVPSERRAPARRRAEHEEPPRRESARRKAPAYASDGYVDLPLDSGSGRRNRMLFVWAGLLLAILAVGYVIAMMFSGTELSIYPKSRDVVVQATFTGHREPKTGELGYTVMTIEKTASAVVKASGEAEVADQASGSITIYNEHSQGSQLLIKNTRFETSDGKIFRIRESVTVPGYTKAGETVTAGKATAQVFADEPGEAYNIGPMQFTIPGLKGTAQFSKMYAKSEAPMKGGFKGKRLTVADADLAAAQTDVRNKLKTDLLADAKTQKPAGFILFDSATFVEYTSLPNTSEGGGQARIEEKGTLYGIVFEEAAFAHNIAENTIAGFEDDSVRIKDPSSLTLTPKNPQAKPWLDPTFEFDLNGSASLLWAFDAVALKNDLAGISKDAMPTVLKGYPAVQKAEVTIRPFWKQTFPKNSADIRLEIREAE